MIVRALVGAGAILASVMFSSAASAVWVRSSYFPSFSHHSYFVPVGSYYYGGLYRHSYLCRSSYLGGFHFGWTIGNGCHFGYFGNYFFRPSFHIYHGLHHFYWTVPEFGGLYSYVNRDLPDGLGTVCRSSLNGNVITGHIEGTNCHIAYDGIEVILPEFEVLESLEPVAPLE